MTNRQFPGNARTWLKTATVLGCIAVASVGCKDDKKTPAPGTPAAQGSTPVDQSSPKAAATTFAKAMMAGDAATAKSVASGPADQVAKLDKMSQIGPAAKKLMDAVAAKYGKDNDLYRNTAKMGDWVNDVEKAELKETGDTATLTRPGDPQPMKLTKQNGKWTVDVASLMGDMPPGEQGTKMMDAVVKAATELAGEITAGKHADANAATMAFGQKMMGGAMPAIPTPPTSGPAVPSVPSVPSVPGVPTPPGQ